MIWILVVTVDLAGSDQIVFIYVEDRANQHLLMDQTDIVWEIKSRIKNIYKVFGWDTWMDRIATC